MSKFLVYASSQKNFHTSDQEDINKININGTEIEFSGLNSPTKFTEYDGIILFNGIWANDINLLATRERELDLLLKNGGIVVFLIDEYNNGNQVDLLYKVIRNTPIDSTNFSPEVKIKIHNEMLSPYLDEYGISKTGFRINPGNSNININTLVSLDSNSSYNILGFCLDKQIYVLPCHIKKNDLVARNALITTLVKCLIPVHESLASALPPWAQDYNFNKESKLRDRKTEIEAEIEGINMVLHSYSKYKGILVQTGMDLSNSVADILEEIFKLKIDRTDNNIQDLKIVETEEDNIVNNIAVVECKGINGNIKREHINQVDSHRERNDKSDEFPGLLIANTFNKDSNSWDSKNREIEPEQIIHAVKMKVLLIRTIDLLRAVNIAIENDRKIEEFKKLLLTEIGWLEVTDSEFIIRKS